MIFRKNVKKGGGHFRSEKFRCKFGAVWSGLEKNRNIFFPKRGGGQRSFGNSSILMITGFPKCHTEAKNWKNVNCLKYLFCIQHVFIKATVTVAETHLKVKNTIFI